MNKRSEATDGAAEPQRLRAGARGGVFAAPCDRGVTKSGEAA